MDIVYPPELSQTGNLRPTQVRPEAAQEPRGEGGPWEGRVTFEAGDQDLHRAGVVRRLLRASRQDQRQQGHADEGQLPPHPECGQDRLLEEAGSTVSGIPKTGQRRQCAGHSAGQGRGAAGEAGVISVSLACDRPGVLPHVLL